MTENVRTNLDVAREMIVSPDMGGVLTDTGEKLWVHAQRVAKGDFTIPQHFRDRPDPVYVMFCRAVNWGMDPIAVLDKTTLINGRIGYESQLIHALVERRSPIRGRLRHEFLGEGPDLRCRVYGEERETGDTLVWDSPKISDIKVKNSPEWANNPRKQLYYHTSRDWARVYFPDAILGLYTRDELENIPSGPEKAKDVSPDLVKRLSGRMEGDGLQAEARELRPEGGEVVAVVQAERTTQRGRPKGSRNKVTMKDIPNIEPFPGGFTDTEYGTEATEKPVEGPEAQGAVPQPLEAQSQPAAPAETLQLGPMLRSGLAEERSLPWPAPEPRRIYRLRRAED